MGCVIHASGTLGGEFTRKQTGKSDWEEAKATAAKREEAKAWDISVPEPPPPDIPTEQRARTRIEDANSAFLSRCANGGIAIPTLKRYKTRSSSSSMRFASHAAMSFDELTVDDMDRFYASWKDAKRVRAKKLERLKSYIKFCVKRKWIAKDIAKDLRAPEGSSIPANKTPFTDDELDRIYAACDSIGGPKPLGPGYRRWGGEDVKDFAVSSIYTGLRISHVATFDNDQRLKENDVSLRIYKTKKELYTWIPDWLVCRLRERQA